MFIFIVPYRKPPLLLSQTRHHSVWQTLLGFPL